MEKRWNSLILPPKILAIALSLWSSNAIRAQTPTDASLKTTPTQMSFDVASVRETKSSDPASSNVPLDRGNGMGATGGLFSAHNQPLISYLIFAYRIQVSEFYGGLMKSLPEWALRDRFDITAKTERPNATKEDMRLMMQSLLEDRFKLKTHRENREVPVFALTLSGSRNTGPQLRSHDRGASCDSVVTPLPRTASLSEALGHWPASCGDGVDVQIPGTQLLHRTGGRNMNMAEIASWLSGVADLDRQLTDGTGLKGSFDFVIDYLPDRLEKSGAAEPNAEPLPTFLEAISDQMGLHLQKGNGQASFFVIDHVLYPTQN